MRVRGLLKSVKLAALAGNEPDLHRRDSDVQAGAAQQRPRAAVEIIQGPARVALEFAELPSAGIP